MGLAEEAIIDSLAHAHGPDMRLQLSKVNGVTVLNDAYNANPNSMRAAIETLRRPAERAAGASRCSATCSSWATHSDAITARSASSRRRASLTCSSASARRRTLIARSAKAAGMEGPRIVTYPDAAAAARGFVRRVRSGDLVLLKARRGIGLEAVAKAIAEQRDKKFVRKAAS